MTSSRRPTMEDVAAAAGVSRALVSIVFRDQPGASEQTRQRIRETAERIGYVPDQRAQLLGRKRTGVLGVTFALAADFHALVVEHVYAAAATHGFGVVLSGHGGRRTEGEALATLTALRCEGLVLIGTRLPAAAVHRAAPATPTVVVLRGVRDRALGVVRTDDHAGAQMATEHLLALGHRRLVHVDGAGAPGAAQRRTAILRAARTGGASVDVLTGGATEEDGLRAGAELVARLRRRRPPTGVVAFNDDCAVGVLAAVRRAGLAVPEDLSVVGFDDSRLAGVPGVDLTTIRQDVRLLAESAVRQVAERAAGDGPAEHAVVPPSLVKRRTTAPPTAG